MTDIEALYKQCHLCPRECGVDREVDCGYCGCGNVMRVARIAPHYWEEPFLSGMGLEYPVRGSGTVFFCGCSLGCVYCQNYRISRPNSRIETVSAEDSGKTKFLGWDVTPKELAFELLKLEENGVHNINFVTPSQYLPSIIRTIELAKSSGLTIPIVYNTSGYEKAASLKLLNGLVDIYLPDMKYFSAKYALDYSNAPDYPEKAIAAIEEMYRQTGKPKFDTKGFMLSGTAVRHLVLPGCDADTVKILELLYERFASDGVTVSLMNQYTPVTESKYPELTERLPQRAYLRTVERAQKLGFKYLYTQEEGTASESFIPDFGS